VISLRYREKGTPIHRLNPLCKLLWGAGILVLALILDHPLFLLLLFISTLPFVAAAGVVKEWASFIRLSLYLCIAIIVINTLVNYNGAHILYQAPFRIPVMGIPTITLEAIVYGLAMCLRLVAIISAFAVITLTVHPDDIMLAMIKLKLPYKSVLVTSLSTRFMPTLIDDVERITDVQRSRGLELSKGSLLRRMKNRIAIIMPLLSNSLDRTVQVAEAMESRAFGSGSNRTYYRDIRLNSIDIAGLICALSPLAFGIFVSVKRYGSYQFYPAMGPFGLNAAEWASLAVLTLLSASLVPLAFIKRSIYID
jgi:energy-coupling factor transport system permease protein